MANETYKVSLQVKPQHGSWADYRKAWIAADEMGVDGLFNWDHFFPLSGDLNDRHYEAYTTLGALAEVTENAMIGSLVTCNSYRNPHLLADMARTLDHISGGRFILGIGSGWCERDYDEYEYEFGTAIGRLRNLKRDLPKIKARLGKLNPAPVQEHLPILIGGSGKNVTLRIVAEHADIWHGFGSPEQMAELLSYLKRHCDDVGRDFSEIELSCWAEGENFERLDDYVALGIRHIMIPVDGPDWDLGQTRELVTWRDSKRP